MKMQEIIDRLALESQRRHSHGMLRDPMPRFPKPHIRPIGNGLYECIRHTMHDEYVSAEGLSAKEAYDACFHQMPFAVYGQTVAPDAPWWRFWK